MRAHAVVARVIQHVHQRHQHANPHTAALAGRAKRPGVNDLQEGGGGSQLWEAEEAFAISSQAVRWW